jgi:hypothetical protein
MNSTRIALWALAAGSFAASGWLLLRIVERENYLREQESRADAELNACRLLTASLMEKHAARQSAEKIRPATTASGGTAPTASSATERTREVRQALLHMPEYVALVRGKSRRQAMRDYGEWLSQLKVTPERLAAIKDALTERVATIQDALDAGVDAGYRFSSREFGALYQRFDREANGRFKDALTTDEYVSYQQYESAKPWVTKDLLELQDYLAERDVTPLSPQQRKSVIEAYTASRRWESEGARLPAAAEWRMRNDRLVSIAGAALQPSQQEVLAGYVNFLNGRSVVLGRVLSPSAPDASLITVGRARY